MRICEKCNIEYEIGLFCERCGSDLKDRKFKACENAETGREIFDHSPDELATIEQSLEPKLVWAQTRAAEAEQMALDATRLLSCTANRLNDYTGQGFFKRCWHKLCGKHGEIQIANQKDLIEMQKYAWRYINLLQERDLLLAHSAVTLKNNLVTLAVAQEETRNEITRMAERVYARFVNLENRVDDLEAATNIHGWLLTIATYDYDEKFSPHLRLLKLVGDFLSLKKDDWNIAEIKYLQQAVKEAGLPWKEEIRLADFVDELIDEIEDTSFSQYQELLCLGYGEPDNPIPASFVLENVPVPSFTSLYKIAESYTSSSETIDALTDDLNISKKDAIKKVLTTFIRKQGIDLEMSIPLRDLAVELMNCVRLTKKLFECPNDDQNFQDNDFTSVSDSIIQEKGKNFDLYFKSAEQGNAEAQFILGKKYFYGDDVEQDKQKAFDLYSKAAEQDLAEAQFELGMYFSEKIMHAQFRLRGDIYLTDDDENCQKAFEWILKAAEQGLVKAEKRLAYMYDNGECIGENTKKAFEWYLKAAEKGDAEAQFILGKKYFDGDGTEPYQQKAFEWYLKAAEQGLAEAQFELSDLYWRGECVGKDFKRAFEWSLKAAEQGFDKAEYRLGYMYNNGECVEKDLKKAFKWYSNAAKQGFDKAENKLGYMYENGEFVKKDLKKAFECFLKAAEKGYDKAENKLGDMYYNGESVEKDYKKAFEWYLKAAEQGLAQAECNLGVMYIWGRYVEKDHKKAFEWYLKAANQGDGRGQYYVGLWYYRGVGVKENKVEALKWYKKACENDDTDAMIELATHYYHEERNIRRSKIYLRKAIENKSLTAMAIYSFIKDTKETSGQLGYGYYGAASGELWISGDNMDSDKLKNAKHAYAGDLADNALVLWDDTLFGSAKEGFLITKDLQIVSHKDKVSLSLSEKDPKSVLSQLNYFKEKPGAINAIVRLAELVKKSENNP